MEPEARLSAGWPGWPADDQWAGYHEVGLTSRPYGTAVEEQFPLEEEPPALPDEGPPEGGQEPPVPSWEGGRFEQPADNDRWLKFCEQDGLDPEATSRIDSRATVLGQERRLAFQPGVPLWVLAWRESVSRSRRWTPAESMRAELAGAFYQAFLRGAYADPRRDFPETGDAFCEHLFKSSPSHGNGRSIDLGDRPDLPGFPLDWCGAAVSFALGEGLRRGGYRLDLGEDWSDYVHRKDWNLEVTEYANGASPKSPFVDDGNPLPKARAGDILTLRTSNQNSPLNGHYAMVLAAKMFTPERGLAYLASGSNGPFRTVAIDLFRIEPRQGNTERPAEGVVFILELNRTSLILPTRRIPLWSKKGREQLKVIKK